MTTSETAASYDAIAHHWNSDAFNRENGINQHRRAIRFLADFGDAIDVGCGSSGRFIELLLEQGFAVEGLDISAEMLKHAKTRHPDVCFHQADIVTWKFPKHYDFITAWDSIWHVPLRLQQPVLEKLCAGLNPGGVLIFTSGGVDEPGEVTNPCHGQPLYHSALGIPKLLEIAAEQNCVCRHLEYDQPQDNDPGQHLYLIFQKGR